MSADLPLLLLVDDEVGVRESLKMVFSKSYRLVEADNVDGALAQVQNARPDVVLLDVLMPKTDGIEVLRRIKEIHSDCAVIILTGINSQQVAAKARSEEHTSELQSRRDLVCRLLLEKKNQLTNQI